MPVGGSASPYQLFSPACDGVVAGDGTGMAPAGGDGLVGARRRVAQYGVAGSPACDGVVVGDGTRMVRAGGDGLVDARRRFGLPGGKGGNLAVVVSPACDGVVGAYGTRMSSSPAETAL